MGPAKLEHARARPRPGDPELDVLFRPERVEAADELAAAADPDHLGCAAEHQRAGGRTLGRGEQMPDALAHLDDWIEPGIGEQLGNEVAERVLALPRVAQVRVDFVFDPPWDRSMMTEAARLAVGLL